MCQFSIIHQVFNSKMGNGIGILFPFMLVLALFFLSTPQISAVGYPINVWPKPTTVSWPQLQVTLLSPNFSIIFPSNPYLIRAANRYFNQITGENYHPLVVPVFNWTSSQPLQSLTITVADENAALTHGVNESYTLSIPSPNESTKATLTAETIWGAMRGLETFSQLVFGNPTRVATGLYIRDEPLYPHRGVVLDTSRNFYEVEDLLRLIKSMSMNKLNVFHWHITDSQSFPLVLPSEPELAGKGAYGEDMKYSPEDVKAVVEFGMEHGVRVVPGIEMPGHTASWAGAYPDIVTCANMFWWPAGQDSKQLAAEPGTGQLNPLSSKTYKVAKNVIHDVATMFPDEFFHAGADEINHNCWEVDPFIQEFIANNGTLTQLLEMFVNSTLPYIISQNRTVVYWEDILLGENVNVSASLLPKENVILQTWLNGPVGVKKLTESGYRVIVSSSDFYYLDCGHGDFPGNDSQYNQPPGTKLGDGGSWCGPFKTWQTIYNYDITYGLNEEEAKLVLGGEVALWSEQSDSTVMDSRIWPRASAMAESLWSGNRDATTGMKRYAEATDRLNEWRNRMVKRGIKAEPIQPLWCIRNPGMCNTVHPYIPGN